MQAGTETAGVEVGRRVVVSPDVIALLLILVIAAAFRLWDLRQPLVDGFSWREASTAMMADNFRTQSWNILFPEVSWTGPGPGYQGREFQLFSYSVAILHTIFGWHDWFGRLVATFFGLITVFSLHRLVARIWDESHAHFAALAYALMPAAIMMDSSFIPDPAMLAFVTTGVWLFTRYWVEGGRTLLILATLALTLGALAKPPGLAAELVVLYLAVVSLRRGDRQRGVAALWGVAFTLAVVASYYAWAIYLGNSYPPYHVAGSGYIWDSAIAEFLRQKYFLDSFWKTSVWWFYGYPFIVLGLIGICLSPRAGRGDPALALVPYVWLLAWCLVYAVAAEEITNNPWNYHLFSVPLAIFCGRGATVLVSVGARSLASPSSLIRSAATVAVVVFWSTLPLMESMKRPIAQQGKLLGERLAELMAPGELSIAIAPDVGDPIAIYYSRARGWVFPPGGGDTVWSIFLDDDAAAIAQLEELRAQGADWFGVAKSATDKKKRKFMQHHAGVLAHLDRTASLVEDNADFRIYRLASPANPQSQGL